MTVGAEIIGEITENSTELSQTIKVNQSFDLPVTLYLYNIYKKSKL